MRAFTAEEAPFRKAGHGIFTPLPTVVTWTFAPTYPIGRSKPTGAGHQTPVEAGARRLQPPKPEAVDG
jgi:hypothetical protein